MSERRKNVADDLDGSLLALFRHRLTRNERARLLPEGINICGGDPVSEPGNIDNRGGIPCRQSCELRRHARIVMSMDLLRKTAMLTLTGPPLAGPDLGPGSYSVGAVCLLTLL